jgi:uncharacterized Fe-S cluster protein YjdI
MERMGIHILLPTLGVIKADPCLSAWPLTQLLNGNLRNLIFYGKSGCITPEQKKCKKNICARGNSHIFIIERKNMPKIMPKNTNFSGYRSITEVSIEQIFETYTQG